MFKLLDGINLTKAHFSIVVRDFYIHLSRRTSKVLIVFSSEQTVYSMMLVLIERIANYDNIFHGALEDNKSLITSLDKSTKLNLDLSKNTPRTIHLEMS